MQDVREYVFNYAASKGWICVESPASVRFPPVTEIVKPILNNILDTIGRRHNSNSEYLLLRLKTHREKDGTLVQFQFATLPAIAMSPRTNVEWLCYNKL